MNRPRLFEVDSVSLIAHNRARTSIIQAAGAMRAAVGVELIIPAECNAASDHAAAQKARKLSAWVACHSCALRSVLSNGQMEGGDTVFFPSIHVSYTTTTHTPLHPSQIAAQENAMSMRSLCSYSDDGENDSGGSDPPFDYTYFRRFVSKSLRLCWLIKGQCTKHTHTHAHTLTQIGGTALKNVYFDL